MFYGRARFSTYLVWGVLSIFHGVMAMDCDQQMIRLDMVEAQLKMAEQISLFEDSQSTNAKIAVVYEDQEIFEVKNNIKE